jgi:hypothetical protein
MEIQRGWILVVDADREIHGLYRRTLAELGFGAEICYDSAGVTLALVRRAYDLTRASLWRLFDARTI